MPRSGINAVAPEAGAAPATTNPRATAITTRAITTASPSSFDHPRSRSKYHRSRLDLALPIGRGVNRVPELGHRPEHRRERLLVENARSEERRVGKECRSRWAPDHEKKKKKSETQRIQ